MDSDTTALSNVPNALQVNNSSLEVIVQCNVFICDKAALTCAQGKVCQCLFTDLSLITYVASCAMLQQTSWKLDI